MGFELARGLCTLSPFLSAFRARRVRNAALAMQRHGPARRPNLREPASTAADLSGRWENGDRDLCAQAFVYAV